MTEKVLQMVNGAQKNRSQKVGGRVEMVQRPGRHVQQCPKNTRNLLKVLLGTYIHAAYRSIFVKCRFKGDTSETSFRSLCKMAFWHQERDMSRAIHVRLT